MVDPKQTAYARLKGFFGKKKVDDGSNTKTASSYEELKKGLGKGSKTAQTDAIKALEENEKL